jgi:hypothetical protein
MLIILLGGRNETNSLVTTKLIVLMNDPGYADLPCTVGFHSEKPQTQAKWTK